MPNYIELFSTSSVIELQNRAVAKELVSVNEYTSSFGIVLSDKDCREIAEARNRFLRDTDRVEVGIGAVRRIITEFCDSSYIDPRTFATTVEELLECFYTIKTETEDTVDDDTVLEFMLELYETVAGGIVDRIYYTEAYGQFIRYARNGGFIRKKEEY